MTTPDELAAYLRETADLALKNISSTAPEVLHHAAMLSEAADALAAQAAPAQESGWPSEEWKRAVEGQWNRASPFPTYMQPQTKADTQEKPE